MAAMALVRLALACVACAAALGAVAAHEASLSHEKMSVWDAFYNRAPKEADQSVWDETSFVFERMHVHEYHIDVAPGDLDWLNHHELLEQYVPARLSIAGETYPKIGFRYKGSKGSLEFCFSNATGHEGSAPDNKRLCKKLSLKLSFDKYDDEGRFHGLKKLNLHGMMNDNAAMRECLSYTLYRAMGVAVPRCAHAKVFINGQYSGLYSAVEYVDSRFLKAHFDDKKAVLYKEVWPTNGRNCTAPSYYMNAVRNRKSSTTEEDIAPIVDFARAAYITQIADVDRLAGLMEDHWNVGSLVNTLAVATVIDDWDSFFTFFNGNPNHDASPEALQDMGNTEKFNHNFYIVQSSKHGKLQLIHWDTDITFSEAGNIPKTFFGLPLWNLPLCTPEEIQEGSVYCTPCKTYEPPKLPWVKPGKSGRPVPKGPMGLYPAACDKIVNTISTAMRDTYLAAMWDFLERCFVPDDIAKMIDIMTDLLKDAHNADPNYPAGIPLVPTPPKGRAAQPVVWEDEVRKLKNIVGVAWKDAMVLSNPANRPIMPPKPDPEKLFKCVSECLTFTKNIGVRSVAECYSICDEQIAKNSTALWRQDSPSGGSSSGGGAKVL